MSSENQVVRECHLRIEDKPKVLKVGRVSESLEG